MALYRTDENGKLIKIAGYGDTSDFLKKDEIPEIDTSNVMDLTTTQTVTGNKTFTGIVIVPDISF